MLGFGEELRKVLRVFVPGVELARCCWVSGLGFSLFAGGGPPCSPGAPCGVLCPVWLQFWFWMSCWLSVLALLSSGETMIVKNNKV